MIVFCEDCGKKNDVTAGQLKDNRAVFMCSHCGYQNAYVFAGSQFSPEDLTRLLTQIQSFPQVSGAMAFHPLHGLFNHMPASLKPEDIKHLLSALTGGFLTFQSVYADTRELILKISKKYLTLTIAGGKWVIIIVSDTPPLSRDLRVVLGRTLSMLGEIEK